MKPLKNLPEVLKAVGKNQLDAAEVAAIIKKAVLKRKTHPDTMTHFEVVYLGYGHEATCSMDFKTPEEAQAYKDAGGEWDYTPLSSWMSGQ